jgi:hypothetical protein
MEEEARDDTKCKFMPKELKFTNTEQFESSSSPTSVTSSTSRPTHVDDNFSDTGVASL